VEILLSMIIKMAAVVLLGAPAWSVLAFEVILNGTAMFNHSNFALPLGIDRVLRTVIVTPDMHRVHHSVIIGETNSNYGFNLSVWDRLFGTYRDQPVKGHTGMTIGLANFRDPSKLRLSHMLLMPLGEKTR
jgi:sterol desaturase/sphingolipid hydroxylase (fatty acid hydroxylase superfamily)